MQDDQATPQNTSSMPPPPQVGSNNEMLSLLIPVGQSGWAIAAGYLGLVSLLVWPLGFIAVLASYKALSRPRTSATMLRIITPARLAVIEFEKFVLRIDFKFA